MIRGRLAIFAVVALACAMAIAAVVHADEPTLIDRLERAARGLPCPKEPQVDARELAEAIAATSHGDRTLAAALLATAWVETGLKARIAAGHCDRNECDSYEDRDGFHARAWGLYQAHRNTLNSNVWGSPSLLDQSRDAARQLRGAYFQCKNSPTRLLAMFRAYGSGRGCDHAVGREVLRVQTLERIRRTL